MVLAEEKMLMCVYASLFGNEVGYLWRQLSEVKTLHSFFHLTISVLVFLFSFTPGLQPGELGTIEISEPF
jgi:hypothetical protein